MTTKPISTLLGDASGHDGSPDVVVSGVAYRSDQVSPGDVFFCVPGFSHDGHDFALDAVSRGASAIVVERPVDEVSGVPQITVPDTRVALANASSAFFDHPSRSMDVVGITGTNGKTTTCYLLESIMRANGRTTGLVGTVETRVASERRESGRTTPESTDVQSLLAEMRDVGVTGVAMEVSSHAIDLHRVDGMHFAVAAFTNLSQDHLDYHRTIEEYFSVKKRFLTEMDVGMRVVNIEDPMGLEMATDLEDIITVGTRDADVYATDVQYGATGTTFTLVSDFCTGQVNLPLAAPFNVSNACVAAGCGLALAIPFEQIVAGLERAPQVPGRLELIDEGQEFAVYVDYAHTPDSLGKAIGAVRAVTDGRVITVFGCGGDRDPEKRAPMGQAATSASDHTIITSDNPRSEDPVSIILNVEDGARAGGGSYEIEVDRRSAIVQALAQARPGDAVLVAGKGHEDYQIFADRTIHFDDREVAREELMS